MKPRHNLTYERHAVPLLRSRGHGRLNNCLLLDGELIIFEISACNEDVTFFMQSLAAYGRGYPKLSAMGEQEYETDEYIFNQHISEGCIRVASGHHNH